MELMNSLQYRKLMTRERHQAKITSQRRVEYPVIRPSRMQSGRSEPTTHCSLERTHQKKRPSVPALWPAIITREHDEARYSGAAPILK